MECPEENVVVDFVRGELAKDERAALEAHLDACETCSMVVAEMARLFAGEPGTPASESGASEPRADRAGDVDLVDGVGLLDTDGAFSPTAVTQSSGEILVEPMALLPQGAKLGRYVVIDRVGAGGMGVVYAAYDPELDRKVAVKVLVPRGSDEADAAARQRLVREAQAMARVSHPNVVAVHDVGVHEGRVFVAMELVEGRTLGAWLGAGRRSWVRVLDVMLQAGRGLAAAHAQGLVHGDFGPDDVTIAEDGRVRVMDLGLARAIDASSGEEGQRDGVAADVRAFAACLDAALRSTGPHGRAAGPRWLRRVVARGFGSMPALLDELARGEARARRRRWLAALVLATGVGAGAFGWQRHTRAVSVRECEAEAASLAETWDDSVAAAVQDALVATGVPRAAGTAERVRPWLDAQAQAWQQARTQACLHARVDGTWSDETLERARWCLDERRMELETLVSELQSGDARIVDRAVPAAWSLRSPAPCPAI